MITLFSLKVRDSFSISGVIQQVDSGWSSAEAVLHKQTDPASNADFISISLQSILQNILVGNY
jgi:hypothetical protein